MMKVNRKILQSFVSGMGAAFLSLNFYSATIPKLLDLGKETDSQKIYNDWKKIGDDMRKAYDRAQ